MPVSPQRFQPLLLHLLLPGVDTRGHHGNWNMLGGQREVADRHTARRTLLGKDQESVSPQLALFQLWGGEG